MSKHIRFYCLCIFLSAIICTSPVYAAEQKADNHWRIPFLGQMTGAETFQAIDMESWLKTLTDIVEKSDVDKSEKKPSVLNGKPFEMPEGVKVFQLQVDDGKAYHIAAAVAIRDEKGAIPGFADYFVETLGPEQTKKLAEWNEKLQSGIILAQDQLATTQIASLKILDLKSLERLKGTNEVIYCLGGRVLFSMNGAMFPLYGKVYVAERESKAVVIVILTSDADGKFWEKTSDRLFRSLHR